MTWPTKKLKSFFLATPVLLDLPGMLIDHGPGDALQLAHVGDRFEARRAHDRLGPLATPRHLEEDLARAGGRDLTGIKQTEQLYQVLGRDREPVERGSRLAEYSEEAAHDPVGDLHGVAAERNGALEELGHLPILGQDLCLGSRQSVLARVARPLLMRQLG